mmetsp:Transcript_68066/g.215317  ORF Transcript_68066/g.215317 Transcript_68066/m.215317 type:complete len:231 (+) Transcript_68066:509-1201(+)
MPAVEGPRGLPQHDSGPQLPQPRPDHLQGGRLRDPGREGARDEAVADAERNLAHDDFPVLRPAGILAPRLKGHPEEPLEVHAAHGSQEHVLGAVAATRERVEPPLPQRGLHDAGPPTLQVPPKDQPLAPEPGRVLCPLLEALLGHAPLHVLPDVRQQPPERLALAHDPAPPREALVEDHTVRLRPPRNLPRDLPPRDPGPTHDLVVPDLGHHLDVRLDHLLPPVVHVPSP